MATVGTDCYCGLGEEEILELIYEEQIRIFDRLEQLIQALEA
jgi:hypothetical protein